MVGDFKSLEAIIQEESSNSTSISQQEIMQAVNEKQKEIAENDKEDSSAVEAKAKQLIEKMELASEISETESSKEEDPSIIRDNLSVGAIFNSGFDWVTNHFSAYLTIEQDDLDPFKVLNQKAYRSSVLNQEGFMIRFGKMTIPSLRNEVFELKIGERTIKKLKSTKQMTRQLSYTFKLDDPLEWLHWYSQLSGVYNGPSENRYKANSHRQNRKLNMYVRQLGSRYDYLKEGDGFKFHSDDYSNLQSHLTDNHLQFFKIEDVKILGMSDIEFNVDSSDAKEITIDFVFKTIKRLREDFLISIPG